MGVGTTFETLFRSLWRRVVSHGLLLVIVLLVWGFGVLRLVCSIVICFIFLIITILGVVVFFIYYDLGRREGFLLPGVPCLVYSYDSQHVQTS